MLARGVPDEKQSAWSELAYCTGDKANRMWVAKDLIGEMKNWLKLL
jgi:hypothetical protein